MPPRPEPPELLPFNGDWRAFEGMLWTIFQRDVIRADLRYDNRSVNARRMPETNRRWASFWHLVSEGPVEDERTPDLDRCARLPWVRWVIENADTHPDIHVWRNRRRGETNILMWYAERYLVVVSDRRDYLLLKTAYCTTRSRRIQTLRRERDEWHAQNG